MRRTTKWILAGAGVLALCFFLFPRLVRWIDSKVDPAIERASAHERQYREMTNAYPMAGELLQEHPIRKRWEECRAALLEAGYIETREFPLRPLTTKGATRAFFAAFHARFPGVECTIRAAKSETPVLVVTARKSDLRLLGDIKMFASQYDSRH